MDFYQIKTRVDKKAVVVYPDFTVKRTKDIMLRGKSFYAIWDEEKGLWSTDEFDVARLIDSELYSYANKYDDVTVKTMESFNSKAWKEYKDYIKSMPDNSKQLDTTITFASTPVKRSDYVSRRLNYDMEDGIAEAYEELVSTLYTPEERQKLEWAIGAIISGDAKSIQKFLVLYGEAGAGKSTVLNIIQGLFDGYYTVFDAKSLTSNSSAFSTEQFKSNPLVAIQHDGDLSRIEDNTKLNSIVSHEEILINEKYKSGYPMRMNCFLFMGTNKPVKITDGKSGIIRRLIDVRPSGRKVEPDRYNELIFQIPFEYGKIAKHCLDVYKSMGKNYYSTYRPLDMMYKTDPFYNFVEENYFQFKDEDGVSLKQAYSMYKEYCDYTNADYKLQMYKFREELKNYFKNFEDMKRVDNVQIRSYYSGFLYKKFEKFKEDKKKEHSSSLSIDISDSIFDRECSSCFAQYANDAGTPINKWEKVKTTLADIDTTKLHYVKVPENHIVIDFDIPGDDGKKSKELNLEAASKFPATYAEFSKSGSGVHLHYIYDGDVSKLSRVFDEHIEVKIFNGNSSLRRQLSKCNGLPIAHIKNGLPLKEEKGEKMVNFESIKGEKAIRTLIKKNLNKECHPGTKPSIDFIDKILKDAIEQGVKFDVTDMRPSIMAFAAQSSHQSEYCLKVVSNMIFKSEDPSEEIITKELNDDDIIFYDIEVFKNLLLICWKKRGPGNTCVRMFNPSPSEVEKFLEFLLVGFNCRRYDNHVIYAAMMGYNNLQLYNLSAMIINTDKKSNNKNCFFGEAWNASYTDVYDFAATKQSLKKWEIDLDIPHKENEYDWNEPLPESCWDEVADYCCNDVLATEAVFEHLQGDWTARKILAELADMCPNSTTNSLTTKIIFGNDKHPQLIYTDLSETFPGYSYEPIPEDATNSKHNMYRGTDLGKGGYVYAEPGIYSNVALLDIQSLHPNSVVQLNMFGDYTKNFKDILDTRVLIKHKRYDEAKQLFGGRLSKYLDDPSKAKQLSTALKIAINSVYGLTSASFDNPFKDPRNENNIVALRGALFMRTLQDEVKARGFTVAHIKTDSIKIPDATPEIIDFCMNFAKQYGYLFEHEATYEKMCLVNDAVYIARYASKEWCEEQYGYCPGDNFDHPSSWTATGAQFQVPYVFKTLFSKEPIVFKDLCETKSVKAILYLDMNEELNEGEHDYHFVGKISSFCPIKKGKGGGELMVKREDKDGNPKYSAATGTKGYRWLEAEHVKSSGKEDDIDLDYYNDLVDKAIDAINKYGSFDSFVADEPYESAPFYGGKIIN